jgi:hypothetical protein
VAQEQAKQQQVQQAAALTSSFKRISLDSSNSGA